jgi:hypothetical protein
MASFTLSTQIAAPPAAVFAVFSDLEHAVGRIKGISKLEVLTPGPIGVGTRFRETRKMFGKDCTEEMQVTAFEPNQAFEIMCQSCGVEFRTMFRFKSEGPSTRVEADMRSRSLSLFAKLLSPLAALMTGPMKKCIAQNLEDLKAAVETSATGVAT